MTDQEEFERLPIEDEEEDTEGNRRMGRAGATRMAVEDEEEDTEGNRRINV